MHTNQDYDATNLDDVARSSDEGLRRPDKGRGRDEAFRRFAWAKRRRQLLDLRDKVEWIGNIDDLRKRR